VARGLVFSLVLVVVIAADMDLAELNGQINGTEREIEESKALLAACEDAEAKKLHQANILSLRAEKTALINQRTALVQTTQPAGNSSGLWPAFVHMLADFIMHRSPCPPFVVTHQDSDWMAFMAKY